MSNSHEFQGVRPRLGANVFLAKGVQLVGAVEIGEESSIWFNCVLRGDLQPVRVGHHTNLQDGTICHVASDLPCVIGNYVSCGHGAILHACTVGNEVIIGMGAVLMDGVEVGEQSIIGARALLTKDLHVPPGSLVYGAPAKVVSQLGEKERGQIRALAEKYCRLAASYRRQA